VGGREGGRERARKGGREKKEKRREVGRCMLRRRADGDCEEGRE
jgi:hypothetical protein